MRSFTDTGRWHEISYDVINIAAQKLLKQNSIRLKKKNSAYISQSRFSMGFFIIPMS
jgi:hypothetical protein